MVAFVNRPNEFKYDSKKYEQQVGLALSGLAFNKDVLQDEVDVISKVSTSNVSFKHCNNYSESYSSSVNFCYWLK